MVTTQLQMQQQNLQGAEYIQQQRQQLEQAKQQTQQQQIRQPQTQQQLRQQNISSMARVQGSEAQRFQEQQQALAQIGATETQFEQEIARNMPELAKEQFLEPVYQEVISEVKPKIEGLRSEINQFQQALERAKLSGDSERRDYFEERIQEVQARLAPYESLLTAPKVEAVKQYFSGEAAARSQYEGNVMGMSFLKPEQTKSYISGISVDGKFYPTTNLSFRPKDSLGKEIAIVSGTGKVSVESPALQKSFGSYEGYQKGITEYNKNLPTQTFIKQTNEIEINPSTGRPYGTLTATQKPSWDLKHLDPFQRFEYERQRITSNILEKSEKLGGAGGVVSAGAGFVSGGLIYPAESILFSVRHPIQAIKGIKQTFFTQAGREQLQEQISTSFKEQPGYSTGFTLGTLASLGVGKGMLKTAGIETPKPGYVFQKVASPFLKQPEKILAGADLSKAVEPFSRQRATLLLKDEKGNYILGNNRFGQAISIGGGIEKGQTPRVAMASELLQETGLKVSDLKNYKYFDKIITPEETFHIFTATIKDLNKIKPSSDIASLRIISPKEAKGYTGMSALNPISSPSGIRSYELGLINYLETGTKPTWLMAQTKAGQYYLATQSRYNVPGQTQMKYLKSKEPLLLAHGTDRPPVIRSGWLGKIPFERQFKIKAGATERGLVEGLYVSPPVTAEGIYPPVTKLIGYTGKGEKILAKEIKKLPTKVQKTQPPGYIGLSYLGFGTGSPEVSLGLKFGWKRPTAYLFNEMPSKLTSTPKTIKGWESEFIFEPGKYVRTKGQAETQWIGGKRVRFQPTEILEGTEANRINKLLSILKSDKTLAEKKIALKELRVKTGIDYSSEVGSYKYVSPLVLFKPLSLPFVKGKIEQERKEKQIEDLYFKGVNSEIKKPIKEPVKPIISISKPKSSKESYQPKANYSNAYFRSNIELPKARNYLQKPTTYKPRPETYIRSPIRELPKQSIYRPRPEGYYKSLGYKRPSYPPIPRPRIPGPRRFKDKRMRRREFPFRKDEGFGFFTETKRRGQWVRASPIGSQEFAVGVGAGRVKQSLAVSLRLREAGTGRVVPFKRGLLGFEPSKRTPLVLIQSKRRSIGMPSGRLSSLGERKEIREAQRLKKPKSFI